jgi:hypothetical protein
MPERSQQMTGAAPLLTIESRERADAIVLALSGEFDLASEQLQTVDQASLA